MNKRNRKERLEQLKNEFRTMIFYEAPHKLIYTLKDMYEAWGNRQVSLAREMTKIHEEVIRGNLKEIIEKYDENTYYATKDILNNSLLNINLFITFKSSSFISKRFVFPIKNACVILFSFSKFLK
jgi:precorrin-4 methylase